MQIPETHSVHTHLNPSFDAGRSARSVEYGGCGLIKYDGLIQRAVKEIAGERLPATLPPHPSIPHLPSISLFIWQGNRGGGQEEISVVLVRRLSRS